MNRARYISRSAFLLAIVLQLAYINLKTNKSTESIAEFKFKMFQNLKADSLDYTSKLNLVVHETSRFVSDSSRIRKGINYLTLSFALWVLIEIFFLVIDKKDGRQHFH